MLGADKTRARRARVETEDLASSVKEEIETLEAERMRIRREVL